MGSKSPKEQCFEDAYNAYQDSGLEKLKDSIEFQKSWGRRPGGEWLQKNSWLHAIRSFLGGHSDQFRTPDMTITSGNNVSVMDLKFDRPSGGRDRWGEEKGAGSNQTQQEDYNDINKQGGGNPSDDPSLNPDKCGCGKPKDGEAEPVTVYEVEGEFFLNIEEANARFGRLLGSGIRGLGGKLGGGIRVPLPIRVPLILT